MLADTAELAAHLALSGVAAYQGEMAKVVRSNLNADKSMGNLSKTAFAVGGSIGKGVNTAVRNIEKLGVVAGGFLVSQVKFGIDSLNRLESVSTATATVLKSTGGVSGQTAKSVRDLAEAFEDLNATIDDKVIQSTENMLLTFTSIGPKAFKPALQAVLDMNQAMGGGEGGLQGVAIQVGKALQDPIRGITALRRVGVAFTEDQLKQIKSLVKHNDLLGAQKIILAELSKEFGGQFAAAGKTATGVFAKFGDAVEGAQQSLATAFLPVLTDVAKELTSLIEGHQGDIATFGKGLAGGFKDAIGWAKQLDWQGIGNGLKTAAGAAKTLVDAFMKAPDWLKTAVITGWGLNKLTGGAVTSIFGDVAKGLGDRFLSRGSSPVNPLFVQQVGLPGAAGVGAAGATGLLGKAASIAQKVFIVGLAAEAADLLQHALGGTLEDRTNAGTTVPGDQLQWPFGPKNTPHFDLGPLKNILGGDSTFDAGLGQGNRQVPKGGGSHSEDRRLELQSIEAIRANTVALRLTATRIEKAWLKTIDPKDIAARSKAVTGHDPTKPQIEAIRQRDLLHQIYVITHKSQATTETKLSRLEALAKDAKAHGDTKTAGRVDKAIKDMKAKIAASQKDTTAATTAGAAGIVGAIAQHQSDLNVYVTTTVTASDIATTTVTKSRMGPGPGSSNNKQVGTA